MSKQYQFCIDGRPASSAREQWLDAAQDAVSAGYAIWVSGPARIKIDSSQGATIKRTNARSA